jgi:Ca2+-binding EF-hand superfamily protein
MPLSQEERDRLKETFDDIDKDKNGSLDKGELENVMILFSKKKPSRRQIARIFKAADANGDGSISFDEFLAAIEKVQLSQEEEWKVGFDAFDDDNSGTIERHEFELACKKLGISLSKTDVDVLMEQYDKNNDNVIDFPEFCALIRSLEV